MEHNKAYHNNHTAETRHPADLALAKAAEEVANDEGATKDKWAKANLVAAAMRGKFWMGAGRALQKWTVQPGRAQGVPLKVGGGPGAALVGDGGAKDLITAITSLFDYVSRRGTEEELKRKRIQDEELLKLQVEEKKRALQQPPKKTLKW
jgi:hypothetical protein